MCNNWLRRSVVEMWTSRLMQEAVYTLQIKNDKWSCEELQAVYLLNGFTLDGFVLRSPTPVSIPFCRGYWYRQWIYLTRCSLEEHLLSCDVRPLMNAKAHPHLQQSMIVVALWMRYTCCFRSSTIFFIEWRCYGVMLHDDVLLQVWTPIYIL